MMNRNPQLDYQCTPSGPLRPRQAGVGIASAVVAIVFAAVSLLFRLEMMEVLELQFYVYSIAFITAFALGVWGLFLKNRRRTAAWIGVSVSLTAGAWALSNLYLSMCSCAAQGWMRMPWPLR